MAGIACHGGLTQIGRVLDHAAKEAARQPVAALVYVGDAMEENIDALAAKAGALGAAQHARLHVPRRPRPRGRARASARSPG